MRAPWFWQHDGVLPRLLSPAGAVYAAATRRRVARRGWAAPVPVICCGGVTAGGAGKTPLALELGRRLAARKLAVAFLTRGYRGTARAALLVDPLRHDAALVGDEALLLADRAPTWVGADRGASARAAIAQGAAVLVMDDGLQNPSLQRTLSFLVVDGESGFGNGRCIPAGPLREPVAAASERCRASVIVGGGGEVAGLPPALPRLQARLRLITPVAGLSLFAFAGIGRPGKFFAALREAGACVPAARAFGDHHAYATAELDALRREAEAVGATLATTAKDFVRLPPERRFGILCVEAQLTFEDDRAIEILLDEVA